MEIRGASEMQAGDIFHENLEILNRSGDRRCLFGLWASGDVAGLPASRRRCDE